MHKSNKKLLVAAVLGGFLIGSVGSVLATSRPGPINDDRGQPKHPVTFYDCGQGFLQTEDCSKNDNGILGAVVDDQLAEIFHLAGYNKQYTCSNGWVVTSPKFCPESGYNNLSALDQSDTLPVPKPAPKKEGDEEPQDEMDYSVLDLHAQYCLDFPESRYC
uniref:Secreted protein n=1 Tax=uncultured Thiotrichaceae bacterium TaxID=298394 RepID=A0A6S6UE65_9GAMM|nr:MAG: Unknown protein [uncultured Thiotrichaceae bacterium]